jgi:hypothetical protein
MGEKKVTADKPFVIAIGDRRSARGIIKHFGSDAVTVLSPVDAVQGLKFYQEYCKPEVNNSDHWRLCFIQKWDVGTPLVKIIEHLTMASPSLQCIVNRKVWDLLFSNESPIRVAVSNRINYKEVKRLLDEANRFSHQMTNLLRYFQDGDSLEFILFTAHFYESIPNINRKAIRYNVGKDIYIMTLTDNNYSKRMEEVAKFLRDRKIVKEEELLKIARDLGKDPPHFGRTPLTTCQLT